jgi:hypothetical protein
MEICFGSFATTSILMAAVTSPATSAKVPIASGAAPSSGQESKFPPPKPYDLV